MYRKVLPGTLGLGSCSLTELPPAAALGLHGPSDQARKGGRGGDEKEDGGAA